MIYMVLLAEVSLVSVFLLLAFFLQDWTFVPYFKRRQEAKELLKADDLLDDLPQGVVRFKGTSEKFSKKEN